MRKFIRHISLVLMITVTALLLLDLSFTAVYQSSKPRNKVQYILKMEPQQMDYVFLGSSRTADNIIAAEVRKLTGGTAINLGIEGASLSDDLLELKLLLDRKVKIKKLFLQVDYQYNSEGVSETVGNMALPYIHNPIVAEHLSDKVENFNAKYYVPFYRYMATDHVLGFREFLFSMCNKKPKIELQDGFIPKSGFIGFKPYEFPAKLARRNKDIEAFQQICKQNRITLVLFCAPVYTGTLNQDYISKLAARFPGFHNYSKAIPDSLFFDGLHLKIKGAKIFTKLIVTDCIPGRRTD